MARTYRLGERAVRVERSRRAILDAARRELARVGYARLRLDDVARRARVSRRTVYAHFRSRSALADAALRERSSALAARVARWQPRGADPDGILDELIAFHARSYREEHALLETLLDGAPKTTGRSLLRALDAERLAIIQRTVQALAARGAIRGRVGDATALVHVALSYPAWRVAVTGPAGRRAPRLIGGALKAALL